MDDFKLYIDLGLKHVLDWQAYDHVLFLIVLTIFYSFNDWKKLLGLITSFTVGHTLSLSLSAYDVIYIKMNIIEFLIPLTILITGIYNLLVSRKPPKNIKITVFIALLFGLIHGLGFSSYFKIIVDDYESKLLPLIEFAIGIEIAQLVIVLMILISSFIILKLFKNIKRDWILIVSSIVIGIVIPMIIERKFW
jgi:hypothetical protein